MEDQKAKATLRSASEKADRIVSNAKVSPFDLDFLVMLHVAVGFDVVFFFLSLFDASTITWLIRIVLNPIPLVTIGIWDYKKTGQLEKAKSNAQSIKSRAQEAVKKAQKMAQKMEKKAAEKAAKKIAMKSGAKVVGKAALAGGGTILPFIGMYPFYTHWVLKTLKAK